MGKKKKAKKISEFDKMRIQRDAYKGMMGYWKEEAERGKREVARLREALEEVWGDVALVAPDKDFYLTEAKCPICHFTSALPNGPMTHTENCPFAALSTPADDWLARHDAEVRQEEQERCLTHREQERAKCLAACVAVQQHWSDGAAESRLPEVNYRMYGAAECAEAIRNLGAE